MVELLDSITFLFVFFTTKFCILLKIEKNQVARFGFQFFDVPLEYFASYLKLITINIPKHCG